MNKFWSKFEYFSNLHSIYTWVERNRATCWLVLVSLIQLSSLRICLRQGQARDRQRQKDTETERSENNVEECVFSRRVQRLNADDIKLGGMVTKLRSHLTDPFLLSGCKNFLKLQNQQDSTCGSQPLRSCISEIHIIIQNSGNLW